MEFRVLGPLEAVSDGGPVALGGPRQRAVLAVLLSAPNETVRRERLIDLVWDEAPPTAETSLRRFVWKLREALREDGDTEPRIVWDQGFRLRVEPGELDVWRFEDAAAEGRRAEGPTEAVAAFRRALDLVRGEPYQGADTSTRFEASRAYLRERRQAVIESYFQARLDDGEHVEIVDDLRLEHARHPLRERLAGQLMLALYRGGRPGDALAVHRDLRARLVDELGAEPGPDVQELHRRILRADPVLTQGPAKAVTQLPFALPVFTGRTAELAALTASLVDHGGPVAVVTGTAGVGKTSLVVHWAHSARDVFPDGRLYVDLRGFTPGEEAVDPAEALRGFLEALGVPAAQMPADLDARSARYRDLLSGKRILIVLDNARDAAQVRPLLPGEPGCRVVITSRDRLTGLVASAGATVVPVDIPSTGQARDLLAARLGGDRIGREPDAVDRIIARCASLPLALALVAARAAGSPGTSLEDLAAELDAVSTLDGLHSTDPATDPRTLFAWSYRRLGTAAARMFQLLGDHPGPDFSLPAAASMAGLEHGPARAALSELVEAHLLIRHGRDRYGRHDLLTAYATELAAQSPPHERNAALHRMHDHYLGTAVAAVALVDPRRPSRPSAPAPGEPLSTTDGARVWFATEYPVLFNAVEHAHRNGLHGHAWRLAWALVSHQMRTARFTDMTAVQRTAIRAAGEAEDLAGRAAAHRHLALALYRSGNSDDGDAEFHIALDLYRRLGDKPALADLYMQLGHRCWTTGDHQGTVDSGRLAFDLFGEFGDVAGQARALGNVASGLEELGDLDGALAESRRSLDLFAEAAGDVRGIASAWSTRATIHSRRGEYAEAVDCHGTAIELFRSGGFLRQMAVHLGYAADTYDTMGERAKAESARREAADIRARLG